MVALSEGTLRRLIDAGRSLVAHLDLERILDDFLEIAAELTGAQYAAIGVLNADRSELERFLTFGIDERTHRMIGELPRGRGILGVLIDEPQPLRLHDVGEHARSYGFPAGHPPMRSFLGVPITIRGQGWGNLYLTEKTGGDDFTEADERVAVILSDWLSIAIENARLYETAQKRRRELERAVQGLEATTAIAKAVGSETDLERVLELIVKRGRALVEARSLVLLLSDDGDLVLAASAGQVQSGARGARIPLRGTAAGEVLTSGRPERLADVPARLALDEEGLGVVGAETGLLVPLSYRGTPIGVLAAFDRLSDDSAGFGDEEESLLLSFAASAATAVATAKSVERDRLRHSLQSAERERRRWARELHDETLQGLAGLRVLLSTGLRAKDPERLEAAVRTAIEQIGTEVHNLRTLITELRPAALDELGLAPAIESLVERVAAVEGLAVSAAVDLEERLEPELETTVYRVIQEALSNVAKHAHAEHVSVRVTRANHEVSVEVTDDGRGFDPHTPADGFGLVGMRERAQLLDGHVDLTSGDGGTTVRASFPLTLRPAVRMSATG